MDGHGHGNDDNEMKTFINVWVAAITSLCYCYFISSKIPTGLPRLFSLLPVFYLFTTLPFSLSSVHLGGITIFYLLWLGNFKLILFSFNQPPLISNPPLSLLNFTSIALLPIKTKQNPNPNTPLKLHRPILTTIKVVLLGVIICLYDYDQYLHRNVIMGLYCLHVYLGVELMLAMSATMVRAIMGLEIDPQFNEPYLATSLQDFWGRRWNLMVSSILRPTVYKPVRGIFNSQLLAVFATFLVSGLMHELIFYYLTRVTPTWEVTWFFVFHGISTAFEVAVKKVVGDRWRLRRAVSGPLTVGFVAVTGVWLFLPQIVRNGVATKAIKEYSIVGKYFRDNIQVYFKRSLLH